MSIEDGRMKVFVRGLCADDLYTWKIACPCKTDNSLPIDGLEDETGVPIHSNNRFNHPSADSYVWELLGNRYSYTIVDSSTIRYRIDFAPNTTPQYMELILKRVN